MPPSKEVRKRISRKLLGHEVSPETRQKISQGLKGRKHTPEAIAKMTAARRARRRPTDEEVVKQARVITLRRRHINFIKRWDQYRLDLRAAWKISKELWRDVKRSWGWRSKRIRFDISGKVSHGFYYPERKTCIGQIDWELRQPELNLPKRTKGQDTWLALHSTSTSSGDSDTTSSRNSRGRRSNRYPWWLSRISSSCATTYKDSLSTRVAWTWSSTSRRARRRAVSAPSC